MKALKWIFGILGTLIGLVIATVLTIWCFPEIVATSTRVSHFAAPYVQFERAKNDPFPNSPMITLEIGKDGFFRRSILIRLAPGCYAMASAPKDGTSACISSASLGVSFRLSRKTYIQLTALDSLDFKVSRARFVPDPKSAKKDETQSPPGNGLSVLHYLDRDFEWGSIAIQIDRFEMPSTKIIASAKIGSAEIDRRDKRENPRLQIKAKAESPDWSTAADGELFQEKNTLVIPKAAVSYRMKSKGKGKPISLSGKINAVYALASGDLDAGFAVNWHDPSPAIESVRAEAGKIRMRAEAIFASTDLKILLLGKTPLGRLPLLTVGVSATMRPPESSGSRPIDFDLKIDSYQFAAIQVKSDLAITFIPENGTNEIRYRKGEVRIEAPDFGRTVKMLSRTSWAIPVPFNVFTGPIVFHTDPFRDSADRSTIPAVLTTALKSTEQVFSTETKLEVDLAKRDFGLLSIKVAALLKKVQFRLPDYEPLAPVPALASDPRIVRYEKPKPLKKIKKAYSPKAAPIATAFPTSATKSPSLPLEITVKGAPGSIVFLNRFFEPSLTAGIDFTTDPATSTLRGAVTLTTPFDLHYLKRVVKIEQLEVNLRPAVEVHAFVSMERSGYRITAELTQHSGKTKIDLGSVPALQSSEIVSLLIYGMPGNSISSEQTNSVGSAQAAMGSEALGIFSFFAFASTPIQSVQYDPQTQTYSAVVSLPGGVTASIGSSWDNERQLALSKSLGKNWALSTELIRDPNGVDRGGTLLRWRKSY